MSEIKVMGIVTRHADYKDSDRILSLFTERYGMLTVSSRGCRRPNSPLLSSSEMFVYGEFVLFENKNRYTLSSCDVREAFYPLREDTDKLYAATYMLSLVNAGSTEQESSGAQLRLLYYALTYCAYTDMAPVDIAVCFAARYLALLGFSPALTRCAVCGRDLRGDSSILFDASAGGAVCTGCGAGDTVSSLSLSLEAVRRMLLLSDEDMKLVRLPERVRQELRRIINEYAEYSLERRFKALSMIQ